MTAAAELFHDDLHVHLAVAARRNIDALAVRKDDERRGNAGEREHFVRSLRSRQTDVAVGALGGGDGAAVGDLAAAHDVHLFAVGLDAAGEHLLDGQRVGSLAAQIGGRLKGAHAGFEHEVFGVEHDARQQRVRLRIAERLVVEIADDLTAHLAGRGSGGLVAEHQRIIDIVNGAAVVVDHDHALALVVQLRAFERGFEVGVHDDQQCFGGDALDGVLRRDKNMAVQPLIGIIDQHARHGGVAVDNDLGVALEGFFHDALHADSGAHAVEVGKAVSHYVHLIGVVDGAADGIGDNAHAHLADLFGRGSGAAEEFVVAVADDRHLVAASAQRHFQRLAGVHLTVARKLGAAAQTDRDRRNVAVGADGADIFEHRKLLGDHFFNVRIPEDHHVAVVAEPFVQAVVVHRPALDICLNRDEDVGKGLVGIGVKVLGVVKADECDRRHIGVIFARRLLVIGILDKMADRAALAAGHDIDGVFLAVERDIHTLAVHDVGDGKAGKIAVDAVALGAPAAAEVLAEPRIAPDNVALLAGDRDGIFVFFKIFGIQTGKMLRRTANGQADICSELQRQRNDHAERQHRHTQLHIKQNEVVGSHERGHKQHDQPEDDKPRGQCPMFSFHSITCLAYICLFGQRAPQIIL